ncbi:MAG: hypothetical protein EOO88_06680 [Pedobacter sp.]|nr:MAG: hypothetical protein EOO88_06680 [Pedobacter sp.]
MGLRFISLIIMLITGMQTATSSPAQQQKILLKLKLNSNADIRIEKAALKYNKQLALSFTLDDGYRSAFLCAYPLLNGGKVSPAFVDGWSKDQGGDGSVSKGLHYSDGCGDRVPFRLALAVNASSFNDTRPERGNLNWDEMKIFYHAGWDILNHSFSHSTKHGTNYEAQVVENNKSISKGLGFQLSHFVVPGGEADPGYDMEYAKAAFKNGLFSVATTSGVGPVIDVSKPLDLNNLIYNRTFVRSDTVSNNFALINQHLKNIANLLQKPGATWYNEFSHGVGNDNLWGISLTFPDFKHYMTMLAARHGATGDDKLWMAPWQEVYEYLWIRDHTVLKTTSKGREVLIELTLPKSPSSFRNHALSLVVKTSAKFDMVASQNAAVKVSSNGKSNHNLINILW